MRKVYDLIAFIFFSFFLFPLSVKAWLITRNDVIYEASIYANYGWKVNTPNPKYSIYSVKGKSIIGEAYSYGDKDNTWTFQSNIDAGLIPRNWKENYDSGHTRSENWEMILGYG